MLTKQSMTDVKISLCILHTTEHQISNYIRLGLRNYRIWYHNQDGRRPQLHKCKSLKTHIPHIFNPEVILVPCLFNTPTLQNFHSLKIR